MDVGSDTKAAMATPIHDNNGDTTTHYMNVYYVFSDTVQQKKRQCKSARIENQKFLIEQSSDTKAT